MNAKTGLVLTAALVGGYVLLNSNAVKTETAVQQSALRFLSVGTPQIYGGLSAQGRVTLPITLQGSNPSNIDVVVDYMYIELIIYNTPIAYIKLDSKDKQLVLKANTNPTILVKATNSTQAIFGKIVRFLASSTADIPKYIGVSGWVKYNGILHPVKAQIPIDLSWTQTIIKELGLK